MQSMHKCARTFSQLQQKYDLRQWVSSDAGAGAAGLAAPDAAAAAAVPDDVLLQLLKRQLVVVQVLGLVTTLQQDEDTKQLTSHNTRQTQVTVYAALAGLRGKWAGFVGHLPGHMLPLPFCGQLCHTGKHYNVSCAAITCWS
jgi:hypothetical protein